MTKIIVVSFLLLLSGLDSFGAPATLANYRTIIQGVNGKFDRDYSNLNPQGSPNPGALGTMETFISALNTYGVNTPGNYIFFSSSSSPITTCAGPASTSCNQAKVKLSTSSHSATLFGTSTGFTYDVVVWMNAGSGYTRFLEGWYSPAALGGGAGKGNITLISCSGCSTQGHSTIEWDTTGTIFHLKAKLYDAQFNATNGSVVIEAFYTPGTGDMKMSVSAQNVCNGGTGDSLCPSGGNTAGYAALLHGNMTTGNIFVLGAQGANTSVTTPSTVADQMCIKSDKTQDTGSPTVCTNAGIDNFTGLTAFSPSTSNFTWAGLGNPWPFSDITDTPTF